MKEINPVDAPLSKLQGQVVALRTVDLVRAHNDGCTLFNVGLVALEPVGAGALELLQVERALAVEHVDVVHHLLERPLEFPTVIRGIVIVG